MTDDLHTVRLLLEQAEARRDEAIAEQLRLEAARRDAESQADQLALYRREYEQRWQAQFCQTGQIELVRCYQGFVTKLTHAVEQQQRVAAHTATQVERAAAIARGHDARATALTRLVERRLRERGVHVARREQQQTDEHAARAGWQARNAAAAAEMA